MGTETPAAPAKSGGPKSLSVALVDGSGAIARVIAVRRKTGEANVYMNIVSKGADGKPKTQKSDTRSFPSMDAAKDAINAKADQLVATGTWSRRASGGAVRSRPADFDFDAPPKGTKAAKASK